MTFRFPTLADRTTVNGKTGSGKTVAGAWLLSNAAFHKQPFVIVDFKREKLFSGIERRKEIDLDEVPTRPGIYHLKVLPNEEDQIEKWLWKVWKQGRVGLFIDEGNLIDPRSEAMKAIMVTGRSLEIPVYTMSQRPVQLGRHVISEQTFYMMFHIQDKRDRETIAEWTPDDHEIWESLAKQKRLPKYHSRWYDVGEDFSCELGPCPDVAKILQTFDDRLKPRKRLI